jgi:drug/metabolite transporter (DMT)-like permease
VGAGLAQFTWAKCLSMLPASTCSLFYPLQAVFAAILGALILGEQFTTSFFVGLLLISADIIISTRETAKGTKK